MTVIVAAKIKMNNNYYNILYLKEIIFIFEPLVGLGDTNVSELRTLCSPLFTGLLQE
jgi:hypothetical protein